MHSFQVIATILATQAILCFAQGVDPSYLTQYYQQIAAQAGHRAAAGAGSGPHSAIPVTDATPIFESNSDQSQQYLAQAQQYRLKDSSSVQEQVRERISKPLPGNDHQYASLLSQPRSQPTPQHTQAYVAPSVRQYLQHPQSQPQPQQAQYVLPQPQPQALAYKPAPAKIRQPEYQPSGPSKLNKEDPEDFDHNPSYQFGFDVKDDEYTNYQNRKEVRDGNVIKGSYSVVDSDGFIRTVKYTADPKEGFKAEVIREPTDIVVKFPTPAPPQPQQHQSQPLLRSQTPQQYLTQQQQIKAPQPQYHYQ